IGIAQTLPAYVFSFVLSQCFSSSAGTRSLIGVTASDQTKLRTGPVAHCEAMSGPLFEAAAVWNALISVSVDWGTTLIVMLGWVFWYSATVSAIHLSAPGASDSAQYQ